MMDDGSKIYNELMALDASKDWPRLRILVVMAEDSDFTIEQSAVLSPRLLSLAIKFRDSTDLDDRPYVFSAIRTGASMLLPKQIDRLLPLMQEGHAIETSQVAMKMVGRIVEAGVKRGLDPY